MSSPTTWIKSSATLGALGRALSYLRGGFGSLRRGTGFLPGAAARRQTKVVAQQRDVIKRLSARTRAARKRADVSAQASALGVESPRTAKRLDAAATKLEERLASAQEQLKGNRLTEKNLNRMLAGKPPVAPADPSSRKIGVRAGLLGLGALGGSALVARSALDRSEQAQEVDYLT